MSRHIDTDIHIGERERERERGGERERDEYMDEVRGIDREGEIETVE